MAGNQPKPQNNKPGAPLQRQGSVPKLQRQPSAAKPPQPVRAKMEQAFGADFSGVRVHESPKAGSIGAAAFTRGANPPIVKQPSNKNLLGHELSHVVQQRQGQPKPKP
jgi:hypothetical protein